MKSELIDLAGIIGISQIGVAAAEVFTDLGSILAKHPTPPMTTHDIDERINPFLLMPNAKSIITALFPYFNGNKKSNISKYAQGEDYHSVIKQKLSPLKSYLENRGYTAEIYADNSPLNDRYLAYKAGLGFIGKNGFLINPKYGTYTFIGYIITDCMLPPDTPLTLSCMDCMQCVRHCCGNALSENYGFDAEKCLSYITQKKGELTESEQGLIKSNATVWGCDKCQDVCPHNRNIPLSPFKEFTDNNIELLELDTDISNKQFKQKYANRAFSWRGKSVLLRNLNILEKK